MKGAKLRMIGARLATLDTRKVKTPPKTVEPFYTTPEYKAWQAEVIARANGRCQDPHCKNPNRIGIRLFADHVDEVKDGGAPYDPANGLARCGSCHTRKTAEARARRHGIA